MKELAFQYAIKDFNKKAQHFLTLLGPDRVRKEFPHLGEKMDIFLEGWKSCHLFLKKAEAETSALSN